MPVVLAFNTIVPPSVELFASNLPVDGKVKSWAVIRIVPGVWLLLMLPLTVIAPWKLNTLAKMLTNGLAPVPMMLP